MSEYTALVAKNAKQAAEDMSKVLQVEITAEQEKLEELVDKRQNFGLFSWQFVRTYGLRLLGTTTTWFLLDIAFYSQNLFQKDLFTSIGWIPAAKDMSAIREVYKVARAQTLIALCGTVPGYWFTVAFIDIIGRFWIQFVGFLMMTTFMFALGIPYHHWQQKAHRIGFIIMYSMTFFFANFGPNATTFVVPAEVFPARLRSTCHGISAAAEKDPKLRDAGYPAGIGKKNSLIVLAVLNLIGAVFTLLVPEAKGKSLEEAAGETEGQDDEGKNYSA
ncbi:Low affinity inorganic phosphate transporter 1 [Ancistrocladus abbreviatus]